MSAFAECILWNPKIVRVYLKTCIMTGVLEMELNSILFY